MLDDKHFRKRGAVLTDACSCDQIGSPISFADEPGCEHLDLPALGQHSSDVLGMLGYSASEIVGFESACTIRQAAAHDIARHLGLAPASRG